MELSYPPGLPHSLKSLHKILYLPQSNWLISYQVGMDFGLERHDLAPMISFKALYIGIQWIIKDQDLK